jgi:copper resistance protein B
MRHLFVASLLTSFLTVPALAVAQDASPLEKPWYQADKYFGAEDMDEARKELLHEGGAQSTFMYIGDRLETQFDGDNNEVLVWDSNAWFGKSLHKLYFKSEGEYSWDDEEIEEGEVQALYSRGISTFFDVQAGVRYDFEPKGRTHAVLGLQGFAPYMFEVDAALFLSTDGDLTARIEAEHEQMLTQRLIIQPRVEAVFAAQDNAAFGEGEGFNSLDLGIRLRYETFERKLAPYIGVEWQTTYGNTENFIKADGGDSSKVVGLIGIRTWF